ncbi:MAG: hypothetical protein KIS78_16285 [Labilithrix sp.]|nr:hypothetical protein [Labilithrix sp.]
MLSRLLLGREGPPIAAAATLDVRARRSHARGARLEHGEQPPARGAALEIDLRAHALAPQDARDEDGAPLAVDRADRDALAAGRELADLGLERERSHADALSTVGRRPPRPARQSVQAKTA